MLKKLLNLYLIMTLLFISPMFILSCSSEDDDRDFVVEGSARFKDIILDESGNPIEGARVIIWADNNKYTDITDGSGEYNILIPTEEFPTFGEIGISIFKNGYRPLIGNYSTPISDTTIYEIGLPLYECSGCLSVVGDEYDLFHLGDDNFSGSINSQFQKSSDDPVGVAFQFSPPSNGQFRIIFLAKGVQCNENAIIYNNSVRYLPSSPSNGDFQLYNYNFNSNPNVNTISILTSSCSGNDKDDWEFIGLHLEAL